MWGPEGGASAGAAHRNWLRRTCRTVWPQAGTMWKDIGVVVPAHTQQWPEQQAASLTTVCTRGHSKARQCNKRHEHENWGLTPDIHGLDSPQRMGGESSPTPLCCQHSRQQPHRVPVNTCRQQQQPHTPGDTHSAIQATRMHMCGVRASCLLPSWPKDLCT